jgi:hypothetical protein
LVAILGIASVGFGVLLAAFSSSWQRFFGGDAGNGWLFIAGGAVLLFSAALPTVRTGSPDTVGPDREPPATP